LIEDSGGDGGGIRDGEHWGGEIRFETLYGSNNYVIGTFSLTYDFMNYGPGATTDFTRGSFRYHGLSSLSSITIYPSAGNMTGDYALYEIR